MVDLHSRNGARRSLGRHDYLAPSPVLRKADFAFPVMFEENRGEAAHGVRFTARVRGALYRATEHGIEIAPTGAPDGERIDIGFIDAGRSTGRRDAQTSDDGKPRKHRRSSKGRTGTPRKHRKSGNTGSSKPPRPPRSSGARPRDDSRPSAGDVRETDRTQLAALEWEGEARLAAETNYIIGRDPSKWRTHVANYAAIRARQVFPGVDVLLRGADGGAEYDLEVAPGTDAGRIRLRLATPGTRWSIDANGDLVARDGEHELRMRKPVAYEIERTAREARRKYVASRYLVAADGTVGFRIEGRNLNDELVIDPALSVTYFSFLGGTGSDSAASIAVDSDGKVYVGGTTTSARTFPETAPTPSLYGAAGGTSDFFIAEINPAQPDSLLNLTFIGGSGAEAGGEIAVVSPGVVAIVGTTTSYDYPVTDSSRLTAGANGTAVNDVAVTELNLSTGAPVYSTLFGGNGNEAVWNSGGIAVGSSGNIFVAMDTSSTNLPTAPAMSTDSNGNSTGPYDAIYGGWQSDGFLAVFNPKAASGTSAVVYCTYLGVYGQPTVTGVAVDSAGNAYLAGYTNDPTGTPTGTPSTNFNSTNGFQTSFGGGAYDGFVMKIQPSGFGAQDLSYGTLLGGSGSDQALAIAVSAGLPGTVYVTGTTTSTDFPVSSAPYQSTLAGVSNAFLAVITQNASTYQTSLNYSTYLGGLANDSGQAVYFSAPNQIYVAGTTTSPRFPWLYNLQPFEGTSDAFVAEIDPTKAGAVGLQFVTPFGGVVSSGSNVAHGNAVAVDANGNAYVAGDTNSSDFPRTNSPANGFQQICQSCDATPAQPDAFVIGVSLSPTASQSTVVFNTAALNFGSQPLGSGTVPPQAGAVMNEGDVPLNITAMGVSGTGNNDFTVADAGTCLSQPVPPHGMCTFEIGFVPSVAGTESGLVTFSDDGAGNPQVLPLTGTGSGGVTANVTSLNFASVPPKPVTPEQLSVQFTNSSTTASLAPIYAVQGSAAFNVAPGNCLVLPAGSTCGVAVTFTPTQTGTYSGELVVTYPWSQTGTAQTVVALTGTSAVGSPSVMMVPSSISFPPTGLGTPSVTETVTVQNNGSAAAAFYGASLAGANPGDFAISSGATGGCPIAGGTLAASSACTIAVTFNSAIAGNFSATLTVSDNATGSPQTVALQGSAVTIDATLSTSSVGFGTSTIGVSTTPVNVTLTNSGSSPLTISAISVGGTDKSDFTAPSNCPASLAANTSCAISVAFNPTQPGSRTAVVQVFDSAPQSPQSVAVSGNAVAAAMAVSPPSASFGSQLANTPSAPQTLTVTNTAASPAVLVVTSAAVNGSTDFSVVKNACSSQLPAAATCTITVQFDPGTGGSSAARSGTLVIQSNAQGGVVNVALSGTAADFELGPAASGGSSASVSAGSTATFNLDLTSSGGFTGSVALTCAGASGEALPGACSIAPASITAASNAQEAFTVTVATSASDARRLAVTTSGFGDRDGWHKAAGNAAKFIFAGAVFAFFIMGARFRRSRVTALLAPVMAAIVFGLVACGGGGASDPVDPPPASNTYSLIVTATSGTATRTLPLTLTVNTN